MSKRPVVLMVLDGYGLNDNPEGNAIAMAKTPVMDNLMKDYPFVKGAASGLAVGLPDGQMGNSEVGHMNIGAGRIIYQDLTRITKAIEDGDFFENKGLLTAIENCKKNNSDLHLWGLLSDGGVHSHITHLYGLLEMAKKHGLTNVYVHAFLDGRDTPPASGKDYIEQLEAKMQEIGVGKIASISGRYYAMDRDNNWDRIQKAYDSLVSGTGVQATDAVKAMETSYADGVTDVIVCEAFAGNIILKLYEGVAGGLMKKVKEGMMSSLRSKIGALLVKPALKKVLKDFDTSNHGGAPLLGLNGLVVKTHGSSKSTEICNSIIQCVTFKEQKINEKIREAIQQEVVEEKEEK